MKQFECIATTTFGIEAVCKRELQSLGFEILKTENGKVTFLADARGIVKANLWLRTADRVLLKILEFPATTFDMLFDGVKDYDWASIIPEDGKFVVNGKSVKSKLFSISDCQKLTKKAIADKLMATYNTKWLKETGDDYTVLVSLLKDIATVTMDTSGAGLHKRGYRVKSVLAPIKETLAASMVLLSFYDKTRELHDLFCGSGTIPIEAAMIGRNIAPGLNRDFAAKHWAFIPTSIWKEETKKAYQAIDHKTDIRIYASDINELNIRAARENAEAAGVDDCIRFRVADFKQVALENNYGILITNPPYGERLEDKIKAQAMHKELGYIFRKLDTWSTYVITSDKLFEVTYKKHSDRKRKLYNGNIEAWYYQYYGPRPKRQIEE